MSKKTRVQCAKKPSYRPQGGGRPPTVTRYLRVKRPEHPLADADGMVRVHRAVLYDKIGPGAAKCHWCKRALVWNVRGAGRLVADHLDGDKHNNAPRNLVPACRNCNFRRASRPDFLTHCARGHAWTKKNTYTRPDGKGRQCRACKPRLFREWYEKTRR